MLTPIGKQNPIDSKNIGPKNFIHFIYNQKQKSFTFIVNLLTHFRTTDVSLRVIASACAMLCEQTYNEHKAFQLWL